MNKRVDPDLDKAIAASRSREEGDVAANTKAVTLCCCGVTKIVAVVRKGWDVLEGIPHNVATVTIYAVLSDGHDEIRIKPKSGKIENQVFSWRSRSRGAALSPQLWSLLGQRCAALSERANELVLEFEANRTEQDKIAKKVAKINLAAEKKFHIDREWYRNCRPRQFLGRLV